MSLPRISAQTSPSTLGTIRLFMSTFFTVGNSLSKTDATFMLIVY